MAKLRGEYRSKRENAPLTLRFTFQHEGKPKRLDAKSYLYVDKDYWENKHFSNSRDAEVRNQQSDINNKLQKIERFILNEFDRVPVSEISKEWFNNIVEEYYNPIKEKRQNENVSYWIQHKIDNAHLLPNSKGGYGLSKSRISKTKTLLNLFVSANKKEIKIKDFDKLKFEAFRKWMIETKEYSSAYSIKMINDLASIFRYAKDNGIEVAKDFALVKYKEVNPLDDDMDVIYLNVSEIQKINDLKLVSAELINARKWLNILCFTGQRGGGFTQKLNHKMFERVSNGYIINYTQKKGNKPITIPVLPPVEELYLNGELPPPTSSNKLNKLFPKLGELAEINEPIMGKSQEIVSINNKKEKRKVKKLRPKFEYIKTHIGRRSFATNHYGKLPNEAIMLVTGHSKLNTFLRYINKSTNTHVKSFLEYYKKDKKQEEKSPLRIIEKAK